MVKRRRPRPPQTHSKVLSREEFSITREAKYIIARAQEREARVVSVGNLVLFSTETGDAWMLDPEDGLALCLARDGDEQSFNIIDTPTNFSIEWNADYRIDGDIFIVADRSGRVGAIMGYPVVEILRASGRKNVGR
jgi:hypothetical protein